MSGFTGIGTTCLLLSLLLTPLALAAPYTINPGDVLTIDVWNEASLAREVLVRPDGLISLPMAGEIDTGGQTPEQVGEMISTALGNFMKDTPRVTVSVQAINGNKIYVIGKVQRPGEYVLTSNTDVMQALALAGGLNTFAAENDILVLRRKPDGSQVSIAFEYADVKAGKSLDSNVILQSRDVVVVP